MDNYVNHNTTPHNQSNNVYACDKQQVIEQQTEPEFNYAVWLLREAIRYGQLIQSLKEYGIRIEG